MICVQRNVQCLEGRLSPAGNRKVDLTAPTALTAMISDLRMVVFLRIDIGKTTLGPSIYKKRSPGRTVRPRKPSEMSTPAKTTKADLIPRSFSRQRRFPRKLREQKMFLSR